MGKRNSQQFGPLRWYDFIVVLVYVCGLNAGCSTDDPPQESVDQAIAKWCSVVCPWRDSCGLETPANCPASCRAGGGFSSYGRVAFYEAMTDCLAAQPNCRSGADAAWATCSDEASLKVELPQAAFDFCASMGRLFFECGFGVAPNTCAREFLQFNDGKLADFAACSTATCDDYQNCIKFIAYGAQ